MKCGGESCAGRAFRRFAVSPRPAILSPFSLHWECLTYDPAIPLGLQAPLETTNAVSAPS